MKTPEEIEKGLERYSEDGWREIGMIHMKLTDILMDSLPDGHPWYGNIKGLVDRLIENGVSVQKWISVKDDIPEKFKDVLACDENGNLGIVQFFDDNKPYEMRECGWTEVEVHYWMYMPEPPKED